MIWSSYNASPGELEILTALEIPHKYASLAYDDKKRNLVYLLRSQIEEGLQSDSNTADLDVPEAVERGGIGNG